MSKHSKVRAAEIAKGEFEELLTEVETRERDTHRPAAAVHRRRLREGLLAGWDRVESASWRHPAFRLSPRICALGSWPRRFSRSSGSPCH